MTLGANDADGKYYKTFISDDDDKG
jgi:hypothetical protein